MVLPSMWPSITSACTAALRTPPRHASLVRVPIANYAAAFSSLPRTAAVSKKGSFPSITSPFQQQQHSWGWQGHHHHRFTSTLNSQLHAAFMKPSVSRPPGATTNTWIVASTVTTCMVGSMLWTKMFGSNRRTVFCAPGSPLNSNPAIGTTPPYSASRIPRDDKDPLINSRELTFGAAMGLCSGYLFKKLGKMVLLIVGLGFVGLQLSGNSGYVSVNWTKVEKRFKDQFDVDRDGKVTAKDAKYGLNWIIELLTRNFQFKSTFAGGFYLGFRYG